MKYVFDIDGTICTQTDGDYSSAQPLRDRIKKNNKLFDENHVIIYLTARGMGRTENNVVESYKLFYDFTKKQLDEWGVKYHDLFLGKPAADIYVDDKGVKDVKFYTN
jgi:acetyl-CoA acetyltransferase